MNFAHAVPVDPAIKSCLDKTIGVKAANKIIAAKKLTKTQTKQVDKCKSAAKGGGSSGSTTGTTTAGMVSLNYGLISYKISQREGLGNLADPALLQVGSTLRMFFKNGNEPQLPLAGFDNKIHSFISSDNGVTWTLEAGVRVDVSSPITVRAAESGGYEAWAWSGKGASVRAISRVQFTPSADVSPHACRLNGPRPVACISWAYAKYPDATFTT